MKYLLLLVDLSEMSRWGYFYTVSKFLGAHIPLKKPIIRERINQARIFCRFGRHPLNPQKYSRSFITLKCCKFVHIRLNFQTFLWKSFQKTWKLVILLYSRCLFFALPSLCRARRDYGLNTQGAKFHRRIYTTQKCRNCNRIH